MLAPDRMPSSDARAARRTVDRAILALAAGVAAVELGACVAVASDPAVAFVRLTARTSAAWFLLAFAARPLAVAWPRPATRGLLRHRRALGLAMAISHAAHLAAIVVLATRGAAFWAGLATSTLVGGSIGFALIGAMAVTSFDRPAARIGRRAWQRLHRTGIWFIWLIFVATYAGQLGRAPWAAPLLVALVGAAGLRAGVAWRRR